MNLHHNLFYSYRGPTTDTPFMTDNVKFLLQRHNIPTAIAADKHDRVLLYISKKELDLLDSGVHGTAESVPDAWVHGNNFAGIILTLRRFIPMLFRYTRTRLSLYPCDRDQTSK